MRRIIAAAAIGLTLATSAGAQTTPNTVIEHFRAYRAAIAQGDLAAADSAATAALAASEAQDGDGGRTAILALNLASLRLERGDRAGALQPAQRAHDLATTRSDVNVDPILAQIVLARAALDGTEHRRGALRAVLQVADAREDLEGDLHLGAADLGRADFAARDYLASVDAWSVAVESAEAAPGDPNVARARALTAEGVAHIYASMRRGRTSLSSSDEAANERLNEAINLLTPIARAEAPRGLGDAARALAHARAWNAALWATLESSNISIPWQTSWATNIRMDERPLCRATLSAEPAPQHPNSNDFNVGAVVVALQTNAQGEIIAREVVSTAPNSESFAREVEQVYDRWRLEWPDEPSDCTRRSLILMSQPFWLDGTSVTIVRGRTPPRTQRPASEGGDIQPHIARIVGAP